MKRARRRLNAGFSIPALLVSMLIGALVVFVITTVLFRSMAESKKGEITRTMESAGLYATSVLNFPATLSKMLQNQYSQVPSGPAKGCSFLSNKTKCLGLNNCLKGAGTNCTQYQMKDAAPLDPTNELNLPMKRTLELCTANDPPALCPVKRALTFKYICDSDAKCPAVEVATNITYSGSITGGGLLPSRLTTLKISSADLVGQLDILVGCADTTHAKSVDSAGKIICTKSTATIGTCGNSRPRLSPTDLADSTGCSHTPTLTDCSANTWAGFSSMRLIVQMSGSSYPPAACYTMPP